MTKKLKLSPWHSGDVKPVHVGVYQRKWQDRDIVYTKWTGEYWSFSTDDVYSATNYSNPTWHQSFKWRGILK